MVRKYLRVCGWVWHLVYLLTNEDMNIQRHSDLGMGILVLNIRDSILLTMLILLTCKWNLESDGEKVCKSMWMVLAGGLCINEDIINIQRF